MAEDSDRPDVKDKLKRAMKVTCRKDNCVKESDSYNEKLSKRLAAMVITGDVRDAPGSENDPKVINLARFAIAEHNKNADMFLFRLCTLSPFSANAPLEFERLVKVSEQAVAGTMYYLTIEAKDREVKKLYKAGVWVKPAMQPTVLRDLKP